MAKKHMIKNTIFLRWMNCELFDGCSCFASYTFGLSEDLFRSVDVNGIFLYPVKIFWKTCQIDIFYFYNRRFHGSIFFAFFILDIGAKLFSILYVFSQITDLLKSFIAGVCERQLVELFAKVSGFIWVVIKNDAPLFSLPMQRSLREKQWVKLQELTFQCKPVESSLNMLR